MTSSLTDTEEYRSFCARAALDPAVFQTFRRQREYEHVVYVGQDDGGRYLARLDLLDLVEAASTIGDPRMVDYPTSPVPLDPVMVRYYHDRQEIRRYFGDLSGMSVLEIGGGFGGLARLLAPEVRSYAICDLPEVRALQDAYLRRCPGRPSVHEPRPGHPYHLIVSTFAFSELRPATQYRYMIDYVRHAKRCWMICNFLTDSLGPDQLLPLMPEGARWEPETPETHVSNRVLVWGDK